ncbi:MAG: TIGR04283 family arsenosugar biosynthesis glycosyltransferase [Halieaceae bacterium]
MPVLNESERIAVLLDSLSRAFPEAQTLVVDGGSEDDTVACALSAGSQLLMGERGRARQMNLGGQAAAGRYLFFLHADNQAPENPLEIERTLQADPEWGFAPVRLSGERLSLRVVEWSMNLRSRLTRVATGDQMLFVRADVFKALSGYADIPLMEDVEICKRLRRRSPPAILASAVETSSRRWESRGVIATIVQMWGLRLAYACGVSPKTLWRYYYGG